jgi:hypothetical protein
MFVEGGRPSGSAAAYINTYGLALIANFPLFGIYVFLSTK